MWTTQCLSSIYIYICCRVKTGPMFALSVLKAGPSFSFKNSRSPCRKKRIFQKNQEKHKNDQIIVFKTGPIMLRNILGPFFNTTLDQCLTHDVFLCFLGG